MPAAGPALSRRTLLVTAAAGAALVACGGRRTANLASDPDAAALDAAIVGERRLLAGYHTLPAGDPDAAAALDTHTAHLTALLGRRGPTGGSETPSVAAIDPVSADDLRKAEAASGETLRPVAIAARDGATAALLAAVAASHAAHASEPVR